MGWKSRRRGRPRNAVELLVPWSSFVPLRLCGIVPLAIPQASWNLLPPCPLGSRAVVGGQGEGGGAGGAVRSSAPRPLSLRQAFLEYLQHEASLAQAMAVGLMKRAVAALGKAAGEMSTLSSAFNFEKLLAEELTPAAQSALVSLTKTENAKAMLASWKEFKKWQDVRRRRTGCRVSVGGSGLLLPGAASVYGIIEGIVGLLHECQHHVPPVGSPQRGRGPQRKPGRSDDLNVECPR